LSKLKWQLKERNRPQNFPILFLIPRRQDSFGQLKAEVKERMNANQRARKTLVSISDEKFAELIGKIYERARVVRGLAPRT